MNQHNGAQRYAVPNDYSINAAAPLPDNDSDKPTTIQRQANDDTATSQRRYSNKSTTIQQQVNDATAMN
jgi:hypothetical protein